MNVPAVHSFSDILADGYAPDDVRELVWISNEKRKVISERLESRVKQWWSNWASPSADPIKVVVSQPCASLGLETEFENWYVGREINCAISSVVDLDRWLMSVLFGIEQKLEKLDKKSYLAPILIQSAKNALFSMLFFHDTSFDLMLCEASQHNKRAFEPWSGAVLVSLQGQFGRIDFGLKNEEVLKWMELSGGDDVRSTVEDNLMENRVPLDDLNLAVSNIAIRLGVELQAIEISITDILQLSVGDVIRSNHPLVEPALIKFQNESLLCKAYIGRCDRNMAVEFLK